jgi:HEPN domain-containing protein
LKEIEQIRLETDASMKRHEWQRYRRQAVHSLDSAERDLAGGDFDWACFKAQQAAELAVKGYLRAGIEYVTGHSVLKLLTYFGEEPPGEVVRCSKELDKVYIPSRYPDAYDSGSPMDYYDETAARTSIDCARRILEWLDVKAAD